MPSDLIAATAGKQEQESLLPELLHALNQPLTSLRCSLELTLLQPRDSEEYRKRLRESLKLTEDIAVLASGIRELLDVENPLNQPQPVAFDSILQSSVRELLPLADAQGVEISVFSTPNLSVLGDPQQISTAIIYLLSFLLNLAAKGEQISLQANSQHDQIEFSLHLTKTQATLADSGLQKRAGNAKAYLRLLVARRIFEVIGGNVHIDHQPQDVRIHIGLPRLAAMPASSAIRQKSAWTK